MMMTYQQHSSIAALNRTKRTPMRYRRRIPSDRLRSSFSNFPPTHFCIFQRNSFSSYLYPVFLLLFRAAPCLGLHFGTHRRQLVTLYEPDGADTSFWFFIFIFEKQNISLSNDRRNEISLFSLMVVRRGGVWFPPKMRSPLGSVWVAALQSSINDMPIIIK